MIPGAGGTQRLPRTDRASQRALDMILTGRNIRARKALQIGLVDELVHPAILDEIAIERARALADGNAETACPRTDARAQRGSIAARRQSVRPRHRVAEGARKALTKTRGHYPAPLAALDAVARGYAQGRERGFREEVAALRRDGDERQCRGELIFLFFATTALKKDPGVPAHRPAAAPGAKARRARRGIHGRRASRRSPCSRARSCGSRTPTTAESGRGSPRCGRRSASAYEETDHEAAVRRLHAPLVGGTVDYSGFGDVDLVIEAVFEDLAVKHQVVCAKRKR